MVDRGGREFNGRWFHTEFTVIRPWWVFDTLFSQKIPIIICIHVTKFT